MNFIPAPEQAYNWSIQSYDGRGTQTNLHNNPMAYGDIINADGSGLITMTNPFLRRKLSLDMRNPAAPLRSEASY